MTSAKPNPRPVTHRVSKTPRGSGMSSAVSDQIAGTAPLSFSIASAKTAATPSSGATPNGAAATVIRRPPARSRASAARGTRSGAA